MRSNFNIGLAQILCPYGNWHHSQGMQKVDSVSLRKMQIASRFSMLIGAGIPIYIGHPDENARLREIYVCKDGKLAVAKALLTEPQFVD